MTSLEIYIYPTIQKVGTFRYGEQVTIIQKVPLGKLPQEVVTSPNNFVTLGNIFIPSFRGATVIKFGQ